MIDLEYYKFIDGMQKVKRFHPFEELYESVAGHSYSAVMLAYDIMNTYDLGLDKNHVIEILLFHDLSENGLEFDVTAPESAGSGDVKAKKKEYEAAIIDKFSKDYNRPQIKALFNEFEDCITREAQFANLIDKLDANIHVLANNCAGFTDNSDYEFILQYTDKHVVNFPELNDLISEVKAGLRTCYEVFKQKNKTNK